MTPTQLDALLTLAGTKGLLRDAVALVLLQGITCAAAAQAADITGPRSDAKVNRAVNRARKYQALAKIATVAQ